MKFLEDAAVAGQRVLLRLGLDVPLTGGSEPLVADDSRLKATLPTLHFLRSRGAKIIIIGKLGRPGGQPHPADSLRPVFLHLSALLNNPIGFAPQLFSPSTQTAVENLKAGELLGLENLEFEPGELANSRTFARQLAGYGELYVDDDFAKAHHAVAANTAITEFLPSCAGLLLEKEYQMLTTLLRHPARPFVAVIGGAKVSDKLPLIRHLLEKADRILVGGAVANTLLKASGVEVGASNVEPELLDLSKELLRRGRGKISLPTDFKKNPAGEINDIGPNTIAEFNRQLKGAKTIFWNGNLGKSEDPAYRTGSDAVAQGIAESGATTVVAGGNTTAIIDRLGLTSEITFISSGGGAALQLLAGQNLPAVTALG